MLGGGTTTAFSPLGQSSSISHALISKLVCDLFLHSLNTFDKLIRILMRMLSVKLATQVSHVLLQTVSIIVHCLLVQLIHICKGLQPGVELVEVTFHKRHLRGWYFGGTLT